VRRKTGKAGDDKGRWIRKAGTMLAPAIGKLCPSVPTRPKDSDSNMAKSSQCPFSN
jgi:hypothetical protein